MGARAMLDALERMDLVFGIFYEPSSYRVDNRPVSTTKDDEIPPAVATLMRQVFYGGGYIAPPIFFLFWKTYNSFFPHCLQRQEAREAKDWIAADNARDKILKMGYTLVDMKGGDATQIIRQ